MKILWLCNIMPPAIAQFLGKDFSVREGWLSGTLNRIVEEESSEIELAVCFPIEKTSQELMEIVPLGKRLVRCYGFYENLGTPENYDCALEERFMTILKDYQPDLLHVFGTEFPHTLAMIRCFQKPDQTLIGLQGLISACAEIYFANLPEKVIQRKTFRDWFKKDGIQEQQQKFFRRGEREKEVLRLTGNVTGRTEFDRMETRKLNPNAQYFPMNETLRSCFYTGKWDIDSCSRHRIFYSQADYPLKGFHFMLEAMPIILQEFPDVELVVAGNNICSETTWKDRMKLPSYGKYLIELIRKYGLNGRITMLGKLSDIEMKEEYLRCHTYVCASVLENSPNSLGEAMLLGVPVVASRAGGIPSMFEENKEGLFFETANSADLAKQIIKIWQSDELAATLSVQAGMRASIQHNPTVNYKKLIEIYSIIGRMKEEAPI